MDNLWSAAWIILLRICLATCDCNDTIYCNWKNDGENSLKWVSETKEGSTYLRIEKCTYPNCGSASLTSGRLELTRNRQFQFGYKIYGDNRVFLRLSKRVVNHDGTMSITPLWEKWASWGNAFPKEFANETVQISASNLYGFELVFDTYIPFREAFVAISGIHLEKKSNFDFSPQVAEEESSDHNNQNQNAANHINIVPLTNSNENQDPSEMDETTYEENEFDNDIDIFMGHISVVIPSICSNYENNFEESDFHNEG